MPTKQQIITIGVLCVVALGLGYWSGPFEKDSGERAEVVAPTIVTNVVTNTLREVVTNIVRATPQPTPTPAPVNPQPTPPNIIPASSQSAIVEKEIRNRLNKPTGELTKADLGKVKELYLGGNQLTELPKGLEKLTQLETLSLGANKLTDVKGLEKLTKLTGLYLENNKLTDVKGLEKLTQLRHLTLRYNQLTSVKGLEKLTRLTRLELRDNPALTKAQIDQLKKALPNCKTTATPRSNRPHSSP